MTISPRMRRNGVWLAVLGVAVFLIFWAGQQVAKRESAAQTDAIRQAIEVHALGLRGAAAKFDYLPFATAMHPDVLAVLAQPDQPERPLIANRYLQEVNRRAGSDALYVIDLNGRTLAASNWDTAQSFVGQDYGNRPYFTDAREGRRGLYYGIGITTGIPGLFISAPVLRDGVVVGVVAVKVSLREIERTWEGSVAPIMLTDARGIVFLGSVASWLFHATRPVSSQDLADIRTQMQYGKTIVFPPATWIADRTAGQAEYLVHVNLEGQQRQFLAIDEALPELGWTLTVMADHTPVLTASYVAWALGGLGTGLLALAWLYVRLQMRQTAQQHNARRVLEERVRLRTGELHKAHAFRKAMEDSLVVGMRARDMAGRIVYVNPALCQMTGYSPQELVGQLPPYPYWHPDDLEKHWRESDASLGSQSAQTSFESRIRHRDGHEVHTMVYRAPLIDEAGAQEGWMSSVVDISEQKRAEARQRLHDEQLQRTGRRASLGELAATLAHELSQPLMALNNFADVAVLYAASDDQRQLTSTLRDIQGQAKRSADIVQRMLVFVRHRTPGIDRCSLNEVVANVLALLRPEIQLRRARVVTRLKSNLSAVSGDRVLLEQVVFNLIMNSLQAMQTTPSDSRVIEIDTEQSGRTVSVRVADRGSGISSDVGKQLFEPFFTTKPEGVGMGLKICRTIIEAHSGRLVFEDRNGGGAIFCIHLEQCDEPT